MMQRSIRVRKPGWMVHVQKGQGEVWCSSGWKDENNEIERGENGEERASYLEEVRGGGKWLSDRGRWVCVWEGSGFKDPGDG